MVLEFALHQILTPCCISEGRVSGIELSSDRCQEQLNPSIEPAADNGPDMIGLKPSACTEVQEPCQRAQGAPVESSIPTDFVCPSSANHRPVQHKPPNPTHPALNNYNLRWPARLHACYSIFLWLIWPNTVRSLRHGDQNPAPREHAAPVRYGGTQPVHLRQSSQTRVNTECRV